MSCTNEAQKEIYGVFVSAVPPKRPDFTPSIHITAKYPLSYDVFCLFICLFLMIFLKHPIIRKWRCWWNTSLLLRDITQ